MKDVTKPDNCAFLLVRTQFTMPIFEYICKDCNRRFEALIMGSRQAACPDCHGRNLAQQFSVFAAGAPRAYTGTGAPATAACGAGAST
jgi:putative FmdB family regulatory protein